MVASSQADPAPLHRRLPRHAPSGDVAGEPLGVPLLRHKLRPPRAHLALVRRRALVQWLQQSEAPLVVLAAPAGYGKTSTLVQWTEADRRPVAWLSLDQADSDPAVFATYMAAALSGVVGGVPQEVFDLLRQTDLGVRERVAPLLSAAIAAAPSFLLVLDDCHHVRSRQCWGMVATLLEQLPRGAQIALAGRRDPPLRLARLRAAGRLAELRMDRLALDAEEAGQLLELHGAVMDDRALAAVMDVTEGWATGVYLAAVLAESLPPDEWLPHIRGDQREIARYLTAEVLVRVPQHTRSFMERTSVLERLCADLCRAVTGRDDSYEQLERLARRSLFVTALDDHGEWYRYHHLFAELLRAELARREPGLLPELHRAAAAWFQEHQEPEAAVRHWLAAGDVSAAMAAMRAARQAGLLGGRAAGTARMLRLFSDKQILADPSLTLFAGWIFCCHCGTRAEQRLWASRVCRMPVDDGPSPMGASSLRSFQALLRAYMAPDGVTQALRDAELCVRLETDPSRGWFLLARSTLAIALYLAGRDRAAADMLADLAEREPRPGDRAIMLSVLALLTGDQGDWERAEELERQMAETDPALLRPDERAGYLAHLYPVLAHGRALSRCHDPALDDYIAALARYRERMVPHADYVLLLSAVVLGEIALEQDDLVSAAQWSDEAQRILSRYADAGIFGPRARRLDKALGGRGLIEPLTVAELHVLKLLQTHLTADQIAAHLFVSLNTVRTHTRALHRKLGTNTRAETVARAVELGLLPPRG